MSVRPVAQDITYREEVENALHESGLYLHTLFDKSLDAILVTNDEGRYIDANPAACALLGYTHEELLQLSLMDLTPESFREEARMMWQQFLETGTQSGQYATLVKDGAVHQLEFRAVANILPGVHVSFSRDITERKQAEEALCEAERKYRDLFENALEGIFQTSLDGQFVVANPALARMFGFDSPEELIRERADISKQHYVDPKRRDEFKRLLEEEGVVRSFEYEAYRKDGSRIWVSDSVRAVRDRRGKVIRYEGTANDITERKQVERAQQESQRQYETLVHSIDGIVWEANPQTFTFTFVSKQAERILGYPLEMWFEGPDFWPDHMHPDDRDWAVAYCVESTNRRVDHQFEYRMIAADGRVVWLRDIVTVLVEDDQSVLLRGVMVDITERKLIEEKLKQSESQLGEAQRLASVGSWNWEIGSNTHTWSDELYHIYGLHPDKYEPCYEAFLELVHPDDRASISRTIEQALKSQEPINSYLRIIRPDGIERIIHSRGNTVTDESGTSIRMHGTMQDVSERKRAEDARRAAEQRYRDIFENAGEGIFQSTPDGKYITVNPALAQMYGFASPEEFIRSCHDISLQIYVDPTRREEFKLQLMDHGAIRGFEYEAYRQDGSRFWMSVNARAVRDEQGTIKYYEGTCQDITERKRAEDLLRESEERYRDLVEHSRELICTHDLDGLILSANRAAAEVLGHDRKDYFGKKNLREILTPEGLKGFDDYMTRIRNDGVASGIMLVQTSSGEHRIWEYYNTLRTSGVAAPIVRSMARDITDRKRAEEALRESEERYRELFENAKDATFVHDLNGRYTSVNRAAEKLLGYPRSEILGKEVTHFFPPEELEHIREFSRKLAEEGETAYESEVITKDGRRVAVAVESHLIFENGGAIAVQGTARDITERKAAEEQIKSSTEQLRESEERYRELFENAKDATYVHDLNGRYTSVNRAAEKLSGYTRDEILGKEFSSFFPAEQIENFRQQLCRKLAEKGETSYEAEVITRDGRRVAVEVNSHLILENGVPVGVQGTARDITERKRAEQKLGEYEKAVEGLDEMIVVIDRDYRYLLANRAFLKYRGLEREQIVGHLVSEVLNPGVFEKITKEKLDRCFEGNIVKYETKYHFPTVGDRHLFISYFPIENSQGIDRVACVLKDITESRQAEERLKANSEQLRALSARLQSAREEEGARIAREIHDELGSVLTSLKWDLEGADKILASPVELSQSAALREKLQALMKLTDVGISAIRRIASELRPSVLDDLGLSAAIEWQAQQFQARTGIVCNCDCSVEIPELSAQQSTAAFRILQEALTNVLRHAQATRVDIKVSKENGFFILSISDNGKGITETAESEQQSLGILGMRERAHLIGGEIDITRMEGRGTAVVLRVPISLQDQVLKMTR